MAGDVAAQSFVNISTESRKKDIETVATSSEASYLAKLDDITLVNYLYIDESSTSTPHLGLIAEDAPEEILAEGGRGVDLYKFISFLTGAMKSLAAEVREIGVKVAALTERVRTRELCLEDVCITKNELQQLLAQRSQSAAILSDPNESQEGAGGIPIITNESDGETIGTTEGNEQDTNDENNEIGELQSQASESSSDSASATSETSENVIEPNTDTVSNATREGAVATENL